MDNASKYNVEMNNEEIAKATGVSGRWVREMWSRYRHMRPEDITWPPQMVRPLKGCRAAGSTPQWFHTANMAGAWP